MTLLIFYIIYYILKLNLSYYIEAGMDLGGKDNMDSFQELESEDIDQFIEDQSQFPSNNKRKSIKKNNNKSCLSIIDKVLIILTAISVSLSIMTECYIRNQIKRAEEQKQRKQNQMEFQSKILVQKFFKKYQQSLLKRKKSQNMQIPMVYKYQKQIEDKIQKLKSNKCPQLVSIPSYLQQQQVINPYEHENLQEKQQKDPQKAQINKLAAQLSEMNRKQAQQQQNIQKYQKPRPHQAQIFQPVGGITYQKAEFAKKLKSLSKQPPWQCNDLCRQQYTHYQSSYKISRYAQLPFCIVVPTFNNEPQNRYKSNLNSIIQQNYTNYHIVIIEDASTDRTGELIDSYAKEVIEKWAQFNKTIKIDIYHNQKQMKAMPNLRKAAMEYCSPTEVFVIVDGDDQIIGKQVFKVFNSQFQEKKSWFVYSNFISFVGTVGFSRPFKREVVEENRYRASNFVTSHLRAFYTQLFRLIKQEDLKDDKGQYLRAANDVAICLPILEMAHYRVTYIPEVTYLYNSNTGLNNHLVRIGEQIENSKLIRKRQKYAALGQLNLTQSQKM